MSAVVPQFHATRCVRYRYRYSECRRCAQACPHEAIELGDDGVTLDRARCQNCALCTSACPTAALVPGNLPRVELLKRAIRQETFSFACAPSGLDADAVVPCLGALDAPTLAYLARRRIVAELRGNRHCAQCAHGAKGEAQLAANLEAVAFLRQGDASEQWAVPTLSAQDGAEGDRDFHANRRQFFRRLAGRSLDETPRANAADLPVPARAIRSGAWFLPETRELLHIVCKGPAGGTIHCGPQEALPLIKIELAHGCTACEACFRVCPTGAIQVRESTQDWTLTFQLDHCVACGVCLEVCQPGALRVAESFDARPGRAPATLRVLRKQRCTRCDRFFVSAESLENCPVCADDNDAFNMIFG